KYQSKHRTPGWRRRQVINFSAVVTTALVVAVFAIVKFTEGAWVVVVLFAILVPALIRMNREYAAEGEVLETIAENQPPPPPHYARRTIFVFVDSFDLATLAALRYARSTSSSTASGRTSCGRNGPAPTGASPWTSSTWPTAGWSGPRPNWSSGRSPTRART